MSAIENCRTAALGGHVDAREDRGHQRIAYNSCRNRHCPGRQGAAARSWLAEREADPLRRSATSMSSSKRCRPRSRDIAGQNKAIVYDLLFRAASETTTTYDRSRPAAPRRSHRHRRALHTWGSALTHHPHVHMIVPGGGISLDGRRWISSRPAFLLPVRVLGMLFRRLFLTRLIELHATGRLVFFGTHAGLTDRRAFLRHLAAIRTIGSWSMPSRPSPALRRCLPISRAIPTGSPSLTSGCLPSTRLASPSATRITAVMMGSGSAS